MRRDEKRARLSSRKAKSNRVKGFTLHTHHHARTPESEV
jgi:hypothetical protein